MLTTLADLTIQVDLVLHPLKSELNFPIGDKEPLDLTRSVAGKGFRWEIPMHLLDALFHAAEGSMCGRLHQSAEAERVLRDMREAVEEGTKLRVLQRTPHLVLLSRSFYRAKLLPILVRWALFWFSMQRKTGCLPIPPLLPVPPSGNPAAPLTPCGARLSDASPPPLPPFRTNWTRLVPPSRTNWTRARLSDQQITEFLSVRVRPGSDGPDAFAHIGLRPEQIDDELFKMLNLTRE